MQKKTVLMIGILGILLVFGAAVALGQNTSDKTIDSHNHECTPEMMGNMSENCPEQMMQSGECGKMMNCGEMMASNTNTAEENHCSDMGGVDMKSMM